MYLIVGIISLVLGIIGIFLPLATNNTIVVLTSFCLLKSSDRLNEKFMKTKIYKKYVKSFPRKRWNDFKSKT